MIERKISGMKSRELSSDTGLRSYGCKNCKFRTYDDGVHVYCSFCMNKILIELGYMKDPMLEEAEKSSSTSIAYENKREASKENGSN